MVKFFKQFGKYCIVLSEIISKPENIKMYWKEFMHQCVEIGIRSLAIVAIISLFFGAIITIQTAYHLRHSFVPKFTIAKVVRDNIILEFSPTLTCIVLAEVVGSKIAGELGNMRVTEQIDALEMMALI